MNRIILVLLSMALLLVAVGCGTDKAPAPAPMDTATPPVSSTPIPGKEWNISGITVDGSTVTVSVRVFADIDVSVNIDGKPADEVRSSLPILEFFFRNLSLGKHAVEVKDVVGNQETVEVEVPSIVPTPTRTITNPTPAKTPLNTIPAGSIQVERVFPGLSFQEMTNLVQPDDASGLIFVTEQRGVVHAFATSQPQSSHVFLDITDRVNRGGNEEGLLGLAFDPYYRENGHFYIYYSAANPRRSVVSRFSLDQDNLSVANPQSEVIILEVEQPFSNHNGGQLAFGPDGYLYIGLGDGGSAGDPQGNGQNLGTLLGSILRIDVSELSGSVSYKIPIDNPFVNTDGARPEIWAYGLRNPWRFSFDSETGLLWAGDVGQNMWEEIDIVVKGANYGWNIMEGFHCYSPATGCARSGLTLPIIEYDHSQGCSVTGGYVYRGHKIPYLKSYYIYGDYCSGNVWAAGYHGNTITENILLVTSGLNITSFGEDLDGNLYILSRDGGIYALVQRG